MIYVWDLQNGARVEELVGKHSAAIAMAVGAREQVEGEMAAAMARRGHQVGRSRAVHLLHAFFSRLIRGALPLPFLASLPRHTIWQ